MATYFTTANIVISNMLLIAEPPQPPRVLHEHGLIQAVGKAVAAYVIDGDIGALAPVFDPFGI